MKRSFMTVLSILTIAATIPAQAQETTVYNQNINRDIEQITPFNLVQQSYQGFFKAQGIPNHSAFISEVISGNIKAEDLVKIAVDRGRLTPETLSDRSYIYSVQNQLDSFRNN